MSFFDARTHTTDTTLLLIVSGSTVDAARIQYDGRSMPHVTYHTTTTIRIGEKSNIDRVVTLLSKAIEKTIEDAISHADDAGKVTKVSCVIGSPWTRSHISHITLEESEPKVVGNKLLNDMLTKHIKEFSASILDKYKMRGVSALQELERDVISIKVNGYSTKKPYGKKASIVEVVLFLSLIPDEMYVHIRDAVERVVHVDEVSYESLIGVCARAVPHLYPDSSVLFVDIEGDITDIVALKDGELINVGTFPVGSHDVVRSVMARLKTSEDEAISRMRAYISQSLSEKEMEVTRVIIQAARESWRASYDDYVTSSQGDFGTFEKVVCIGNDPTRDILAEILQEHHSHQVITHIADRTLQQALNGRAKKNFVPIRIALAALSIAIAQ